MTHSKPYTNILFYLLCLFILSFYGAGGENSATDDLAFNVGGEFADPPSSQGTGEITYISDNDSKITVSAEGTLIQGTATITATISDDGTYAVATASIEVTINTLIEKTTPTISSFSSDLITVIISKSVQFS